MTTPQAGIFDESPPHNLFLEFGLDPDAGDAAVRRALGDALTWPLAEGQHRIVGFGDAAWRRLAPEAVPDGLRPFEKMGDPGRDNFFAPATQRDVWVWLQASAGDANFDLGYAIERALGPVAYLGIECQGLKYHGNRDLIGFVDGTGNPKTDEDKRAAALIPGAGGGAFAFTQKWVHDLARFNAEPVSEQERIVGRTKDGDIELEGDDMPPWSHVSRTDVKEDGIAMKVYRRSAPYAAIGEHGLYYLAFTCALYRVDIQLRRMYGLTDDGLHDRLIEYSRAVTGAYWYVPGSDELSRAAGE